MEDGLRMRISGEITRWSCSQQSLLSDGGLPSSWEKECPDKHHAGNIGVHRLLT